MSLYIEYDEDVKNIKIYRRFRKEKTYKYYKRIKTSFIGDKICLKIILNDKSEFEPIILNLPIEDEIVKAFEKWCIDENFKKEEFFQDIQLNTFRDDGSIELIMFYSANEHRECLCMEGNSNFLIDVPIEN